MSNAARMQGTDVQVFRLFRCNPERPAAFNHGVKLVHREIGLAVDLPIIGLGEKVAHRFTGHAVERLAGDGARVPQGRVVASSGKDVNEIMIGPHQGELDAVAIRGLQKALAQAAIRKASVIVAIPVKQDGGGSVIIPRKS